MIIHYVLSEICYSNSTTNEKLQCADGDFAPKWNGCINQDSYRVRCPTNTFPCNDLAGNGIEFSCHNDCADHGGRKTCQEGNIFYLNIRSVLSFNILLLWCAVYTAYVY